MSFGPPIVTSFYTNSAEYPLDSESPVPLDVAERFITSLPWSEKLSMYLRPDTYTDKHTGITHVYARQAVYGWFEIANANMNMNIRDGKVTSYGTSLFHGDVRARESYMPTWTLDDYCNTKTSPTNHFACGHFRNRLRALAEGFNSSVHEYDPTPAALFFALAASAEPMPAHPNPDDINVGSRGCQPLDLWQVSGCRYLSQVPNTRSVVVARRVYVQTPVTGSNATKISLAWGLEVELADNRYMAYISVHDPFKVVMVVDITVDGPDWNEIPSDRLPRRDAAYPNRHSTDSSPMFALGGTYKVWRWDARYPSRNERTFEHEPYADISSPQGWHKAPAADYPMGMGPGGPHGLPWSPTTYSTILPTSIYPTGAITVYPRPTPTMIMNYTSTGGNNVIAEASWVDEQGEIHTFRPSSGPGLMFDFPYPENASQHSPSMASRQCANATVTQYFYLANIFHDLMFLYGFDEESGNFQQYNFARSEGEQDAVIVNVRDGNSIKNTSFTATPDGQSAHYQVNARSFCNPLGNEEIETRALFHALSLGLVSRMTGGPRDPSCLGYGEAAGLRMGWSGFISGLARGFVMKDAPTTEDFKNMQRPFHTRSASRPLMYDELLCKNLEEAYDVGEIWADLLEEVLRKLIFKHGLSDSLFPRNKRDDKSIAGFTTKHGNTLMLQ
ncbi:extracellular metalloproteinase MEP [Ceratobasidium sp. AG-Ba]|nr:extracellular metalloproteinase MEP [Ceratobasidium sp. AG-Ba]